jgi:flagellar biosynthesis protein FliQ
MALTTTSRELMLQVAREGIFLALLVSAPPVLASWLAGLVVGVFQAVTQIQETSIAFVPKLVAVVLTLLAVAPALGAEVLRFAEALLLAFPHLR